MTHNYIQRAIDKSASELSGSGFRFYSRSSRHVSELP